MRLIENKEDISYDKVTAMIFWELTKARSSYWTIVELQGIDVRILIHSNYLLYNIYDDINRE
jgi:hypothetical protein